MVLFGISSNTLALSKQSSSELAGGASDGCGLGRGAEAQTAGVRLPRPGSSRERSYEDLNSCASCLVCFAVAVV